MGAVPLTQRPEADLSALGVSTHDLAERIRVRSTPSPKNGCWLWKGHLNGRGYGAISIKNHPYRVHRISYMVFVGPIPKGLFVCHKCDVPACVNPDHLFIGTQSDNMVDSVKKGRQRNTRKTHCPKGHPYDEENTFWRGKARQCKKCREALHKSAEQKERLRAWHAAHPERRRELELEWRTKNHERRKEINRTYQARNRDKRRLQSREYYYRKKTEKMATLHIDGL